MANIFQGFAPEHHWGRLTALPRNTNCTTVFLITTLAEKPAPPKKLLDTALIVSRYDDLYIK